MYNLEVYQVHNYSVSEVGVLVHNSYFDELKEKMGNLVKTFEGSIEIKGNTLIVNVDQIVKNPSNAKNATFGALTQYAEDIARAKGLTEVHIQFNVVINSRLGGSQMNSWVWGIQHGYTNRAEFWDINGVPFTKWKKTLD